MAARWAPAVVPACRRIHAANIGRAKARAAGAKSRSGTKRDNGPKHRRQISGLPQRAAPFVEPGIFTPVEIIDHRVFFGTTGQSDHWYGRDALRPLLRPTIGPV